MNRYEDPQPIKGSLDALGRRLGMGGALQTGIVWRRWAEIVGPGIAGHAEPTSLKEGVLRVRADSPAWATEIGYLGGEIVRRANALVGAELLREVRVWTGPGKVRGSEEPPERPRKAESSAGPGQHHDDPMEALAAAHEAWRKRRYGGKK